MYLADLAKEQRVVFSISIIENCTAIQMHMQKRS